MDSATAALAGTVIGGAVGVIGTVYSSWAASKREREAFLRAATKEQAELVHNTYEYALNVLFNLKRGANPDRNSYGKLYAQISLFGSAEVKGLLDTYLAQDVQSRLLDTDAFVAAMKRHIDAVAKGD